MPFVYSPSPGHAPSYQLAVVLALFASAVLTSCERDTALLPLLDDGRTPYSILAATTKTERVSSKTEHGTYWRDAVRFEAGEKHSITVANAGPGDVVRWGLKEDLSQTSVDIRWSGKKKRRFESDGSGHWQDFSVTLSNGFASGQDASLTFTSSSPFWLSNAEVVPRSVMPPQVIVVLIDTLRQDHLSCYGYDRETSPHIDAFREDSVLFSRLVPPTSWTRPSVASLLTSTYPGVHGAQDRGDRVREGVTWLADVMGGHGYESHAILSNPNCIQTWGFGDDFDRAFEMDVYRWLSTETDSIAVELGIEKIKELRHRPYFMYLHALAPHSPYEPPSPFDTMFTGGADTFNTVQQRTINMYDGEIAYFDSLFGDMVAALKKEGVYDSSLIVVLSDHGEEFWDHGGGLHGKTLYEEQLQVPLLIKFPTNEFAGARWDGIVEMVDVAPTMLDILDLPARAEFQGVSVLPYIGTNDISKEVGYAELFLDGLGMRSAKTLDLKYIDDIVGKSEIYFNLDEDPRELSPLDEAPDGIALIKQHSDNIAMMGNSGLHVLITHDSIETAQISGFVRSDELGEVMFRYPDSLSNVARESNQSYRFSATLPAAENPKVPSVRWQHAIEKNAVLKTYVAQTTDRAVSEQNYAELVADVSITGSVRIELHIDGKPFPSDQTHIGSVGKAGALDGSSIKVADIVAAPYAFDPTALPTGTAVYVWYLPSPETIADDELSSELRESLEALGYITE